LLAAVVAALVFHALFPRYERHAQAAVIHSIRSLDRQCRADAVCDSLTRQQITIQPDGPEP
jgi:hypothetical protein